MSRHQSSPTLTKVGVTDGVDLRPNIPTEELRDFVADEFGPNTALYPRDSSLDRSSFGKAGTSRTARTSPTSSPTRRNRVTAYMTTYGKGGVALVHFPFIDGSGSKKRAALVISTLSSAA